MNHFDDYRDSHLYQQWTDAEGLVDDHGQLVPMADEIEEETRSPIARRVAAMVSYTRSACNRDKLIDVMRGGQDNLLRLQMKLRLHLAKIDVGLGDVLDAPFIKMARELEEIASNARGRRNPKRSLENMLPQA